MIYRLNDVYTCVQGEGCQAGLAMVLVRLHGCGVGCPWCDTKETWIVNERQRVATIAEARGANAHYAEVDEHAIARYVSIHHAGPQWILLTGGEPADQELRPLVEAFHAYGYKVAIETSGTARGLLDAPIDWVCVSPKVAMPGGRDVLPEVMAQADEVKMVIGKDADLARFDALVQRSTLKQSAQLCLQPVSQSTSATALCIDTVQARGWRLSIQMHKYLRLP
jgi:7-carboxy-7-deazaguanine synthase